MLAKKSFKSLTQLITNIKREWAQLSADYAKKLSESMTRRCDDVAMPTLPIGEIGRYINLFSKFILFYVITYYSLF